MKKLFGLVAFSLLIVALASSTVSAWSYWPSYTYTPPTYTGCVDSDGMDYFNKGTVTYYGRVYTDSCYYNYVKEKYCNYGRALTKYYYCSNGCNDGACVSPAICGNDIIEGTEQCDDGVNNGVSCSAGYDSSCNYCSSSCEIETVQGPFCGDGTINNPPEQCDDGNIQGGDGCSVTCQIECAENWDCSDWSECTPENLYKYRTCTDLNSCGTTYQKPITYERGTVYNTWMGEEEVIDIGNLSSESGFVMTEWGPIEPDTHGGLWGKSPTGSSCCPGGTSNHPVAWDGSTRVISTTGTGDNATIEVKFGVLNFYDSQRLEFMALKGISGDDSFDVYLNNHLVYSFVDDGVRVDPETCPENWVEYKISIDEDILRYPNSYEGNNIPGSEFYALVNLTFVSTAPHWTYYDTYGQVAISEITTKHSHNVKICR